MLKETFTTLRWTVARMVFYFSRSLDYEFCVWSQPSSQKFCHGDSVVVSHQFSQSG